MNDQNIMFGYPPPMKNSKIEKYQSVNYDECSKKIDRPRSTQGISLIYPKYWELSWAIKMEFCIFEKVNNSIATKLCVNLINDRIIFEIFPVHYKIQWLNYVVHFFNVKINWKFVDKINAHFWSALKWQRV